MSFVPSIRPLITKPFTAAKRKTETFISQNIKPSQDVARFGNHNTIKPAPESFKFKDRAALAFKHVFTGKELLKDTAWGAGLSLVSFLIPPHAHALFMFPAMYAVGATIRTIKAFSNPAAVHALVHNIRK